MKNKLWTVVAIFVVIGLAGFPFCEALAKDSIRFGYSIALTGIQSAGAQGQVESYKVWQELVNRDGGIYVKEYDKKLPVEMVFYDDKSDTGTAVRIYEKLITQDKVDLLLPPYATTAHFAVAPLAQKYKVPLVGGTAASIKLREIKNDYFWFVTASMPDRQMRALMDLLVDLKINSMAVVYVQDLFPRENLQFLEEYAKEAKIDVVLTKDYSLGEKDLTTLLSQVKAKNPDALIALSYPGDTFTIVTQSQEVGLNPKFFFNLVGPATIVFKPKFGSSAEGIAGMGNWHPTMNTSGNKEFYEGYKSILEKEPDYLNSVDGYVPCQIMKEAIETVGSLDREKLRDFIANHEFQTILGPVKFTGSENTAAVAGVLQWQKGNLEVIWPKSHATAEPLFPKPEWPKK